MLKKCSIEKKVPFDHSTQKEQLSKKQVLKIKIDQSAL